LYLLSSVFTFYDELFIDFILKTYYYPRNRYVCLMFVLEVGLQNEEVDLQSPILSSFPVFRLVRPNRNSNLTTNSLLHNLWDFSLSHLNALNTLYSSQKVSCIISWDIDSLRSVEHPIESAAKLFHSAILGINI